MPSWIAELLQFERDGDTFLAREPGGTNQDGRLFGGLVAAQSLAAAGATLAGEGKRPQSLHAYFVRGGRPEVDVELVVERTRDGRSFDTRRVTAVQGGAVIFELLASFHIEERRIPRPRARRPLRRGRDARGVDGPGGPLADRDQLAPVRRGGSVGQNRPRFMTLSQAATKSATNFSFPSSQA